MLNETWQLNNSLWKLWSFHLWDMRWKTINMTWVVNIKQMGWNVCFISLNATICQYFNLYFNNFSISKMSRLQNWFSAHVLVHINVCVKLRSRSHLAPFLWSYLPFSVSSCAQFLNLCRRCLAVLDVIKA